MRLEPPEDAEHVALGFDTGDPAIVEGEYARGKVIVFALDASRDPRALIRREAHNSALVAEGWVTVDDTAPRSHGIQVDRVSVALLAEGTEWNQDRQRTGQLPETRVRVYWWSSMMTRGSRPRSLIMPLSCSTCLALGLIALAESRSNVASAYIPFR